VLLAEWLGEAFGRWADSLPEDQHHALVEYKGDGCRALNAALRRDPLSDAQGLGWRGLIGRLSVSRCQSR